jgi:sialate O-acetylesterase
VKFTKPLFVFTCLSVAAFSARADVKLPSFFSDHMVLQQRMKIPVWGWASPGESVTVGLAADTERTTADATGKWRVNLAPLHASETPLTLTVTGKNKIAISDVLIGEVWLCSGQSNMERQLRPWPGQPLIDNWEKERDEANHPLIRQFHVGTARIDEPATNVNGKWEVCSPATVPGFTAVGYFFARDLQQVIKVPIGIINSTVGGTPAEAWTARAVQADDPELRGAVTRFDRSVEAFPSQLEQYKQAEPDLLKKHEEAVAAAKLAGKPEPRPPAPPRDPRQTTWAPGSLYNGMIAPLMPYAIRGVVWYQGESNNNNASAYQKLFPAMIADWRKGWGEGDFPFLYVQIAPFPGMGPFIREAQLLTLKTAPNTAMVVTTDAGFRDNIHPPHKQPVGARLALAARALAYGEKIEYSGPLFDSVKFSGNQAILSFAHLGGGLVSKDGDLKGFEIASADKKFVSAKAIISGDNVLVSSDQLTQPVYVRYGWANFPEVNLFNRAGLPASPFRTDAGPLSTIPDGSHSVQFASWYRNCANRVAAIKGKPCDIIFIGDSITDHWVDAGHAVWEKFYAPRHALDYGLAADTTGNVLWRFDHMPVRDLYPKVAVVMIGTNNTSDTPEDVATGVKAVVDRTRAEFKGVKVILVSILPNARATEKMADANEIIRTFADNRSVFYFDLAAKMPRVGDNWLGLGPDRLHPDASGYELWAESMEPLLTHLLAMRD